MKTEEKTEEETGQETDPETGEKITPETNDEKAFNEAFGQVEEGTFSDDDTSDDDEAGDDEGGQTDEDDGADDGGDTDDDQGNDETDDTAHKDVDTGEDELTEAEKQQQRSWQGRLKADETRIAQERADLERQKADFAKRGKGDDQGDEGDDTDKTTLDEGLDDLLSEFPDVKAGVQELIKREVPKLVRQEVQPVVQKQANVDHMTAIAEAHPDWEESMESGALDAFIDRQPSSVQGHMRSVIKGENGQGQTKQVIDLLNDFDTDRKAEIGTQKESQQQRRRKKQVGDGLGVRTKGGPQVPKTTEIDPDDFDGAFDKASAKLAKDRAKQPT